MKFSIGVLSKDVQFNAKISEIATHKNYSLLIFNNFNELYTILSSKECHLLFLEVDYGSDFYNDICKVKEKLPNIVIILICKMLNAQDQYNALKLNLFDSIENSIDITNLEKLVDRALKISFIKQVNINNTNYSDSVVDSTLGIPTKNIFIKKLINKVMQISSNNLPIVIIGEHGVGKKTLARKIHEFSITNEKHILFLNCSEYYENDLEIAIFGKEDNSQFIPGILSLANDGTIVIEDIDNFPKRLQPKLLKLITDQTYKPVHSFNIRKNLSRLIFISNTKLDILKDKDLLDINLFYLLSNIVLYVPSLKSRIEDLPLLINFFLNKHKKDESNVQFSQPLYNALITYDWPGNIPQLEMIIKFLISIKTSEIRTVDDLPFIIKNKNLIKEDIDSSDEITLKKHTILSEGLYIIQLLKKYENNKNTVSNVLNIDSITINRKLERYQELIDIKI